MNLTKETENNVYRMLNNLSLAETYEKGKVPPNLQTMNTILISCDIEKRELLSILSQFIPDAFGGLNDSAGNWAQKLFNVTVKAQTTY
jgi:hypothetical protein